MADSTKRLQKVCWSTFMAVTFNLKSMTWARHHIACHKSWWPHLKMAAEGMGIHLNGSNTKQPMFNICFLNILRPGIKLMNLDLVPIYRLIFQHPDIGNRGMVNVSGFNLGFHYNINTNHVQTGWLMWNFAGSTENLSGFNVGFGYSIIIYILQ